MAYFLKLYHSRISFLCIIPYITPDKKILYKNSLFECNNLSHLRYDKGKYVLISERR